MGKASVFFSMLYYPQWPCQQAMADFVGPQRMILELRIRSSPGELFLLHDLSEDVTGDQRPTFVAVDILSKEKIMLKTKQKVLHNTKL